MRRIVALILMLAFAALATGIPQQVHQQQHDCQNCRLALLEKILHHRTGDVPAKPHTDQACQICALLYAPALASSPPVVLVDAGAAHAQIVQFQNQQTTPLLAVCITCRGPPAC